MMPQRCLSLCLSLLTTGAILFIDYPVFITPTVAQTQAELKAEADRLNNLGIQQYQTSRFREAIESWEKALEIYQQIKDRQGEANCLGNFGNVYDDLGQYQKAIEFYQQSLAIFKELGNDFGEATVLTNLGITYDDLGQHRKAIEYYQQSLTILRKISPPTEKKLRQEVRLLEAASLANLGIAYNSLGQYQEAIDYHQQSLVIFRELGNPWGEAKSLSNLGGTYDDLKQYEKAIEYYQKALAIKREINDHQGEAKSLGNLANAYYSLEQHEKAIEYNLQSIAIFTSIGDREGKALSLNNLGAAYLSLKNYPEAENALYNSLEVYESLRVDLPDAAKISIFDTQTNSYRNLQQALIAQNKTQQALEISERGRARAFVELLASKQTNNPKIKPITLTEIQQVAKEQNATLVEYSLIPHLNTLYIYIVNPQGEVNFKQVSLESINLADLVTLSREGIGVRSRSIFEVTTVPREDSEKNLQTLHQLLIEPIAEFLPKNPTERVIFLPQGELFLVPFPALKDTSGHYLIDKHTILTAPAIQVLQLTHTTVGANGVRPKNDRPNDILIVGNPTMPKVRTQAGENLEQLSSLPGAEREAIAIAQLFNTQAIIGKDATKSTILQKLPTAKIVHFATHGLLDDFKGIGVPGAIAFAPIGNNQENDGLLTAGEILDLKLNIDLMVLSACDTGRGTLTGDGVVGLSRSLITAGVSSLIVSLWSVPDAPTAELMTGFYQQLQQNPDKAQALRQAMLKTKEKHPNPRDWAAFTLIGEAE